MARFGLSPYGNPIEAGIDSFAKLSGVFRADDELKLRQSQDERHQQDDAQRRQLTGMQIQTEQDAADERTANKPIKDNERRVKLLNQTYGQGITAGMTELNGAMSERRPPKLSADSIASILGFADDHSHLGGKVNNVDDHVGQSIAANKVVQGLSVIGPNLQQHAQQSGQTSHRIDNSNAPGFIDDVNEAFKDSNLFGGKEVQALGVDMARGVVTVAVKGKEGPELLKGEDGNVKELPISELQNMANKSAHFGNLVVASYAQMHGDDALAKEVSKKKTELAQGHARADVLAGIKPDATPKEKIQAYVAGMAKKGYEVKPAEAKELFDEKTIKSGMAGKVAKGKGGKLFYLDNAGEMTDMEAPNPEDKEARTERRASIRDDRKESLDDKKASRKSVDESLRKWHDDQKTYQAALAKKGTINAVDKDVLDEMRSQQNQSRRTYEDTVDQHSKNFSESYAPGSPKGRAEGLTSAGKGNQGGAVKSAPMKAVQAAVNTATSREDAVAILKRQGYTHDENGKPLN